MAGSKMPDTTHSNPITIVIEPETPEEALRRTQQSQRRFERLVAPAVREQQRLRRLIDMARPRHLAFIEDQLRRRSGVDALMEAAREQNRHSRLLERATEGESERVRRWRHALDPLDKIRPIVQDADRLAAYKAQPLRGLMLAHSEGARGSIEVARASWTSLATAPECLASRVRSVDLMSFRTTESVLMAKVVRYTSSIHSRLALETETLRKQLNWVESIRLPSEWMEVWWALQDANTIRSADSSGEEKNEAWIGLIDFLQNRLQFQLSYVPRFVLLESRVEDLDEHFDATDVLMRELERAGWRRAQSPTSYLRTALIREANRFYREQLQARREHYKRSWPVQDAAGNGWEPPSTTPDEAAMITGLDWERACSGLNPDQRSVLSALFDDFRRVELGDFLGWETRRVDRVLKSLSADRGAGREVRRRLRSYRN
jgi:hypothetical protein